MAKGLNFRSFAQPTLPISMNDTRETLFTITTPTVGLVEELEANRDTILAAFGKEGRGRLDELWDFAAKLISCNREGRAVTADELKGRYGMNYDMLFAFYTAYMEFLAEIEQAKN